MEIYTFYYIVHRCISRRDCSVGFVHMVKIVCIRLDQYSNALPFALMHKFTWLRKEFSTFRNIVIYFDRPCHSTFLIK